MMIQSIDCTHARDLIIGALEGETLTESERATLDAHLAECAGCRSYRQTMQHLAISLKAIPQAPVPAGLSERIMAQLAEEAPAAELAPSPQHSGGSAPVLLSRWRRYSPIAAAVLVIAMAVPLAFFSMRQGPYTEHSEQNLAQRSNHPVIHEQPDHFNRPYSNGNMEHADGNGPNGFNTGLQPPSGQNDSNPSLSQTGANRIANASPGGSASFGPNAWSGGNADASFGGAPVNGQALEPGDSAGSELLAAADPSASMSSAVSGETESDLYYDPVSALVGF